MVGQHGARPGGVTLPVIPADLEVDRLTGHVIPADAPLPGPGERGRGRRRRGRQTHAVSPARFRGALRRPSSSLKISPPWVACRRGRGRAGPAPAATRAPPVRGPPP